MVDEGFSIHSEVLHPAPEIHRDATLPQDIARDPPGGTERDAQVTLEATRIC